MSEIEKRESYRCPVTDLPSATIFVRQGKTTESQNANVFDESAGGFGVIVPGVPIFETGDHVGFRFAEKEMLCQVTHVVTQKRSIHRVGLKIVDELDDDPRKRNSLALGGANYLTRSSSFSVLAFAFCVVILAIAGYLYHESTKVYRDEYGRKYRGSVTTAAQNLYRSVFSENEEPGKAKRKSRPHKR